MLAVGAVLQVCISSIQLYMHVTELVVAAPLACEACSAMSICLRSAAVAGVQVANEAAAGTAPSVIRSTLLMCAIRREC
jgi:hypothetical protein